MDLTVILVVNLMTFPVMRRHVDATVCPIFDTRAEIIHNEVPEDIVVGLRPRHNVVGATRGVTSQARAKYNTSMQVVLSYRLDHL